MIISTSNIFLNTHNVTLLNTGALPRRLSEELFGVKLIIAKIMNMFFYLLFYKEE
jgi:hypothetical protein